MLINDQGLRFPDVSEDFVLLAFLEGDGNLFLSCDTNNELCEEGTEVTVRLHGAKNLETVMFKLRYYGLGIVRDEITIPSSEAKEIIDVTLHLPPIPETRTHRTWNKTSLTLVPPTRSGDIAKSFSSLVNCDI